ncbi:MAG: hypothetical protein R2761_16310 [Acidimicrobiales bacterium]
MTAAITWLYSDSDGNTDQQTKTAAGLSFLTGDRILVVGFTIPDGWGDAFAMGVTDTASTNNPTWSTLATGATNTYDSAGYPAKLVLLISDELTADETFDITLDPHTGNTNAHYMVLGIARLTGITGSLAQAAVGAIAGANVDDATCTFGSSPTAGNLQLMIVGHIAGDDSVTWDTPPTDFAQVSGSTATSVGNMGISAISSTTATATGTTWGYENAGSFKYGINALKIELEAAAGGPVEGTATLTYGGAVSATGTPTRLGTAASSYGGTVAATGQVQHLGTAALGYGGTVTATGTIPPVTGTAALAYGGSVAASGQVTHTGSASLAYGGSVASAGQPTRHGTGASSYGGSAAATGTVTHLGTAALGYGGSLAATGTIPTDAVTGTATLAYGGSVAATGQPSRLGTATASYGGALAATGQAQRLGTASVGYGGTANATGTPTRLGTAALAYGGTVTATGIIPTGAVLGTATVAYGGVLAATGTPVRLGTATLAYASALAAAGQPVRLGSVALAYGADTTATGTATRLGTAILDYGGGAAVAVDTDDPNPITLTIRDTGHTATIRDTGHTATVRENR